jgi:LysM repeat protein
MRTVGRALPPTRLGLSVIRSTLPPRGPRIRRRPARRTLGALLALAVVATAHAPSVITVRSGDTLWDLARAHGTTVSALRELNALPGNAVIHPGQRLRVGGHAARAVTSTTHVVRSGETLSHLAARYGTTVSALRSANRLSGSTIRIGQRLAVPGATRATAPVSGAKALTGSAAQTRAALAARSHPSKAQVRRTVAATARRHGVPASLAVAVAYHESGFQQRVVSGVNAIGVMQVLPVTGRAIGRQHGVRLDLLDTQDNITAGVLVLRQLLRSTGSTDMALAGYYQGLGSIGKKGLLPQTHTYIRNVTYLRTHRFPNG